MTPKEFVDSIHDEKAKSDSNSADLARALNMLSTTVFGKVNRFVFELLQNADDSPLEDESEIDVVFHLLDNYLIFSHNGAHFTDSDVMGISAMGASEKEQAVEKTGYKGIGFKSVFGTSDYAHIISGEFSFRFDKNYEGWNGSKDFPWQVIPIWTDDIVDEAIDVCDIERVNTIIGIANRDSVRREIEKVFKDCQILLFLRRVNSITFLDNQETIFQISKEVDPNNVVSLMMDNEIVSTWIIKNFDLTIDEGLNAQLKKLGDEECPKKLKDATNTTLTFAACVNEDSFVKIKEAPIYSYLPTKAKKGFSFLINGDFLLNAERTDILENAWNVFLFEMIAEKQLEWFLELQDTDFRYDILTLLKGMYSTYNISDIDNSYNESLSNASKTIEFIPEHDNEFYNTISASITDPNKFCKIFSPKLITDFLRVDRSHGVVNLDLKDQAILNELGAKSFSFADVINLIASDVLVDSDNGIDIIVFFYNSTINGKNAALLTTLANTRFIMDEGGAYNTPKEIFFPEKDNDDPNTIDFEDISFVHSEILLHFRDAPAVIKWLSNLGVKEPTALEIVKKAIFPLIAKDHVDETNAIEIARFVFRVFLTKELSDADYENLKSLMVLSANGLKLATQCYLSDLFIPEKKLSAIIPGANFIIDGYPENDEDVPEWKSFLKKIGVRDNIVVETIEETLSREELRARYPYAGAYLNWLDTKEHYPSLYRPFTQQHGVKNFTALDFRAYLGEAEFSKFFWNRMLIQDWSVFKQKCTNTVYSYYGGKSNIIPSFVEYYIQEHNAIPCTDGSCYQSNLVFSPALKNVIGKHFPVADMPANITVEQIEFFKFKRSVSIQECLDLLVRISNDKPSAESTKQIFSIYDQLISKSAERGSGIKEAIEKWRIKGKILTLNNTYMPVIDLHFFNVLGKDAPINSERFAKFHHKNTFEELGALCELLLIPVITQGQLQFVPTGDILEYILPKALKKKAPYIVLIYSHESGENFSKALARFITITGSLSYFRAESLNLIYETPEEEIIFDVEVDAWSEKSKLYFTEEWNAPLTLYGLSSTLCAMLGYRNMEREFGLLLQLSDQKIQQWLIDRGYDITGISDEIPALDFTDEVYSDKEIDNETNEFEGIDITFEESFIPKIQASEIDFQDIRPVVKHFTEPFAAISKEYVELNDKQVMKDVGRWCEEFIFNYFKENQDEFTEINWLNEVEESNLPYDFEVVENGVKRLIEVKGTPSLTKEIIYISPNEWKVLFEQGECYTMFRVFGAGLENYRFERTDDLRSLIEAGKIMPTPIRLMI